MNIRKAAYDAVVAKLESELATVQSKVRRNKVNFRMLAEDQAKLKRERGILTELINDVTARKKDVKE